jgi:predicted NAD-dependent protein-ADP-ribosyltransferase YbiA (DUF1768 family)
MVQTIKIFNPKDRPFGWLSNNYRHLMFIDKNRYLTVTNYIYSNMLSTPQYRTILKNSPVNKVYETYVQLAYDEEVNITRQAVDEALDAKFNDSEVLAKILLSTGNSEIIYNSSNKVLGVNSQGEGLNLYGNALKQIRQRLRSTVVRQEQEKTDKEYEDALYETYVAYKELVKAIKNGNTLEEYLNMTPKEVINAMGRSEVMSRAPSKEFVINQLHGRKNIPKVPGRSVRFQQPREEKTDMDRYLDSLTSGKRVNLTNRENLGQKVDWDKRAKEEDLAKLSEYYQQREDEGSSRKSYKRPRMRPPTAAPPEFIVDPNNSKSLIEKEVYEIVNSPKSLVYIVRKQYLVDLQKHQLNRREEAIAMAYAEFELAKNFPDIKPENYKKAINQQFEKVGYDTKLNIGNAILVLYKDDKLPKKLTKAIDSIIRDIAIPSEQDVIMAEQYTIEHRGDEDAKNVDIYKKSEGQTVVIFAYPNDNMKPEYNALSPLNDHMFKVNEKLFPTVSHYVIFKLFQNVLNNTTESYSKILGINAIVGGMNKDNFVSPETATARLNDTTTIVKMDKLKKYMYIGMNNKFLDRLLQDLLILTEDAELVYTDQSDVFLGVGPQGIHGDNEVGKYLMVLRERFREERKDERVEELSTNDITQIIEKDEFFRAWVDMRVTDMCKVVTTMKTYLFRKDGKKDIELTGDFVDSVMDDIYQPCANIFSMTDKVTAEVPYYFKVLVLSKPGFSKVSEEIVEILWKRIAVMIYFMIEFSKDRGIQNIRAIIAKLEMLVSKGNKCVKILDNELDNCIASALINIISGLAEFNSKYSSSNIINKIDVETAASIIVNRDISNEIEDMVPNFVIEEEDEMKLMDDPQIFETIDEADEDLDQEVFGYEDDDFAQLSDDEAPAPKPGPTKIKVNKIVIGTMDTTKQLNNIQELFSAMDGIKHVEDIENVMLSAIETIKNMRMSVVLKNNRINFFATQR